MFPFVFWPSVFLSKMPTQLCYRIPGFCSLHLQSLPNSFRTPAPKALYDMAKKSLHQPCSRYEFPVLNSLSYDKISSRKTSGKRTCLLRSFHPRWCGKTSRTGAFASCWLGSQERTLDATGFSLSLPLFHQAPPLSTYKIVPATFN